MMCNNHDLHKPETWPDFSNALTLENTLPSVASLGEKKKPDSQSKQKRLKLWEMREQVHCSIVGTCASVTDIKTLARKVGINLIPNAPDYAVHGCLVEKTMNDTPFARAFQKMLDQRFQGALRKVLKTKERDALEALWNTMVDDGFIAAGYWAFMTCAHVPNETRELIYGDVHMYSHLAGSCYRKKSHQANLMQNRISELEERLKRNDRNFIDALNARDEEITRLRKQIERQRMEIQAEPPVEARQKRDIRLGNKLVKLERALISARQRARQAEAHNDILERRLENLQHSNRIQPFCPAAESLSEFDPDNRAQKSTMKILYVGGRTGQMHHLKSAAEKNTAILVHHDGGLEDTLDRMDPVITSVDCVMCPIDCVSHSACLRAKKLCMKQNIPFFPLRTSSQASLCAAIDQMRRGEINDRTLR